MYKVVPFDSRWCVTGPFLPIGDAVFLSEEDALMACLAAETICDQAWQTGHDGNYINE